MTLTTLLQTNIKKLTSPLKNEDELILILKKRLTKKEFKVLIFTLENLPLDEQLKKLSLDKKRYKEIKTKAFKKINFHDLKEELMISKNEK
jgi:reverse gyrase